MKLPTKIVDISQPLDNETVVDPPFMRPNIEYVTGAESAELVDRIVSGSEKRGSSGRVGIGEREYFPDHT